VPSEINDGCHNFSAESIKESPEVDDSVNTGIDSTTADISAKAEKERNLSILRGIVGDKRVHVASATKLKAIAVTP